MDLEVYSVLLFGLGVVIVLLTAITGFVFVRLSNNEKDSDGANCIFVIFRVACCLCAGMGAVQVKGATSQRGVSWHGISV